MFHVAKRIGMAVAALVLAAGTSQASIIVVTETAIGSGSLGGTNFTNQLITMTSTYDTSAVAMTSTGFFRVANTSASVTVAGIGTGSFSGSTTTFDNQTFSPPAAGIADVATNASILDTFNNAFASYDLKSAIGPITGPAFINSGQSFATSAGAFIITSVPGNVTYTAAPPTTVPEPSTFAQAGIFGVMGLTGVWLRRKRAAA
jgi:hypothetical protein